MGRTGNPALGWHFSPPLRVGYVYTFHRCRRGRWWWKDRGATGG